MSLLLSEQDKLTLRTAAYGAVSLLAAASATGGTPYRIAAEGCISLSLASGPIGGILADKKAGVYLAATSVSGLGEQVLPALTAAMALLRAQAPAEADNFRATVLVAVEAAVRTQWGEPNPAVAEATRSIVEALDAMPIAMPRRSPVREGAVPSAQMRAFRGDGLHAPRSGPVDVHA